MKIILISIISLALSLKAYAKDSLLFIGDSITWGQLGDVEGSVENYSDKAYSRLLKVKLEEKYSHLEVNNVAQSGSSTPQWLPEANIFFERIENQKPPKYVHIMFGTNDSAGFFLENPVTPDEYRKNLNKIIAKIKSISPGVKVFLTKPPLRPVANGFETELDEFRNDANFKEHLEAIQKQSINANELVTEYWKEIDQLVQENKMIYHGVDMGKIMDMNDFKGLDIHPTVSGHSKTCMDLIKVFYKHLD